MQKTLRIITTISIVLSFLVLFHSIFSINAMFIREMPIKIEIGENIGFDVNSTALTFGKIQSGSTSTRKIILTNNEEESIRVILKINGAAERFIQFEQNPVILSPQETKEIGIFATAPENAEKKEYTGEVRIYSTKI